MDLYVFQLERKKMTFVSLHSFIAIDLLRSFAIVIVDDTANGETCYLNFARLINSYITPFAKPEPQTALQYTYLIAMGSDLADRQKALCLDLVRDIVLASRSWSKLLGSVRADGTKQVC